MNVAALLSDMAVDPITERYSAPCVLTERKTWSSWEGKASAQQMADLLPD